MGITLSWSETTLTGVLPHPLKTDPQLPTTRFRKITPSKLYLQARSRLVWHNTALNHGKELATSESRALLDAALARFEHEPKAFIPQHEATALILARQLCGEDEPTLEEAALLRWVEVAGLEGTLHALLAGSDLRIQLGHPRLSLQKTCLYVRPVTENQLLGESGKCAEIPALLGAWMIFRRLLARNRDQYLKLRSIARAEFERPFLAGDWGDLIRKSGIALAFPDETSWADTLNQHRRRFRFAPILGALLLCGTPEQQLRAFTEQPYSPEWDPYLLTFIYDVGPAVFESLAATLELVAPPSRKARAQALAQFRGKEVDHLFREFLQDASVKSVARSHLGMKRSKKPEPELRLAS